MTTFPAAQAKQSPLPPVDSFELRDTGRRRAKMDRFDLLALVLLGALSCWVLGLDLWQEFAHGRVWTGTDGLYLVDQAQYVAWVSDASHHLLVSNLFVLHPTPRDYFMPAIAISGGVAALGVAPWLALLLWKPVAVLALFLTVRAYVRRMLRGTWPRRAALFLGLFFGSFSLIYGSVGVLDDLLPGPEAWGYPFGLIGLAAMIAAMLTYERAHRTASLVAIPGLLGALASLLHPWQGELMIAIVVIAELQLRTPRGARRRIALPALTVALTAIPLAYYGVLAQADPSWRFAREAGSHAFSFSAIAIALAPLALPAALAYRRTHATFLAAATRAWPLAALGLYELSATRAGLTPLHAFEGISIPLSILATLTISGWRSAVPHLRRALGFAAVLAFTVPATVYALDFARRDVAPSSGNANFIDRPEHAALGFLAADRRSGGVLTRLYLGSFVPGITGRRTYVGTCVWSTPNCQGKTEQAEQLFGMKLSAPAARAFVLGTGARFVLADCKSSPGLERALAPILSETRRFGCAGVYVIRARL